MHRKMKNCHASLAVAQQGSGREVHWEVGCPLQNQDHLGDSRHSGDISVAAVSTEEPVFEGGRM